MIELLLQAERSLEKGSLEQAERLYWQAIDADSQNAIAIVGLAKVARKRGDDRTAIAFGRRALQVDADDAVAKRLVAELEAAHPETVRPAIGAKAPAVPVQMPNEMLNEAPIEAPVAAAGDAHVRSTASSGSGTAWPVADSGNGADPPVEARQPARADVEWPAADLKQVRPPDRR